MLSRATERRTSLRAADAMPEGKPETKQAANTKPAAAEMLLPSPAFAAGVTGMIGDVMPDGEAGGLEPSPLGGRRGRAESKDSVAIEDSACARRLSIRGPRALTPACDCSEVPPSRPVRRRHKMFAPSGTKPTGWAPVDFAFDGQATL